MDDAAFQRKQQGRAKRAFAEAVGKSSLPSVTRHLLLALVHYARLDADALLAWPTTERLATFMGVDRRSVSNHLRIAEAGRWLDRRKLPARYGQYKRNVYALLTPGTAKNGNDVPTVDDESDAGDHEDDHGNHVPIMRERGSKTPGNDVPTITDVINQCLEAEGDLVLPKPGSAFKPEKPAKVLTSDAELREKAAAARPSPSLRNSFLLRGA